MLVISATDNHSVMREFEFHTGSGERLADRFKNRFPAGLTTIAKLEVYASGHELQAIQRQLSNFPIADGRSSTWTGDLAWFVVNNVKM